MKLETTDCFKNLTRYNPNLVILTDEQVRSTQKIVLETLHDVVLICERLDIDYHLTGGSALGAVRHQGFIPWDDDVDIDMARKDIDRFLVEFKREYGDKYWIHTPKSEERFCMPGYHIRRKNTVFQGCTDPDTEQSGIGVDIAIMENAPDNLILRKIHGLGSLALGLIVSCRRFYRNRTYLLGVSEGVESVQKIFKRKIRIGFFTAFLPLDCWMRIYDKWNSLCHNENSKYVAVPTGRKHYFGELYLRSDFAETTSAKFEDLPIRIPKEYDKYLKHMYGDYMVIPSQEKREQHVVVHFEINV